MDRDEIEQRLREVGLETRYRPGSAHEAFARIAAGTEPWVAVGDFVDDWRRSSRADRLGMITEPLGKADSPDRLRWAALLAATVDQLAWDAEPHIEPPAWAVDEAYVLDVPWFLLPGWRLRMHQLVDTPAAFKRRNIYGGDRILSRA